MPFELKHDPELEARAKTVILQGVERQIYPLTLRQILRLLDLGKPPELEIGGDKPPPKAADFDYYVDVLHIGLSRAYPSLTRDELLDGEVSPVDLINAHPIVLSQSGAERKGAGESKAASPSGTSTGDGSSPTS